MNLKGTKTGKSKAFSTTYCSNCAEPFDIGALGEHPFEDVIVECPHCSQKYREIKTGPNTFRLERIDSK